MRAVIYARFSPRPDAETSESNETQIDLCRAYCRRVGWEVAAVHQDAGASGDDEDRPGLWAAVDDLRRSDALVVYKLDRLARSAYLSYCIERAVERAGARIVSVTGEGTGSDSPEDMLVRRILQALAEYQKRAQAARTKAAMLRHQANGRRMSGRPPIGTLCDPGNPARLVPSAGEQEAVELIRRLRIAGCGLREIARRLDEVKLQLRHNNGHDSVLLVRGSRVLSSWTVDPSVMDHFLSAGSPADWDDDGEDGTPDDYGKLVAVRSADGLTVVEPDLWEDRVRFYAR